MESHRFVGRPRSSGTTVATIIATLIAVTAIMGVAAATPDGKGMIPMHKLLYDFFIRPYEPYLNSDSSPLVNPLQNNMDNSRIIREYP